MAPTLTRSWTSLVFLGLLAASRVSAGPITPADALARARTRSPDLRAALAEISARRAEVLAEERARNALVRGGFEARHDERLGASGDALSRSGSETLAADAAVVLQTDAGTQIEVGADAGLAWSRFNNDPSGAEDVVGGPTSSLGAFLTVRQPLLRGAGEGRILADLRRARAVQTAAERSRDELASALCRDVLRAYWELWYAEAAVVVERQALAVSERQVADIERRNKALGTVPVIDVLRLQTERSSRRQRVTDAEGNAEQRRLDLAVLLGESMVDAAALSTVARPELQVPTADLVALEALSLSRSPTLAEADARIEAARETVRIADDERAHRLDLIASVGTSALWSEDGRFPGDRPAFTALVGLDWEFPIGASSADARRDAAEASLATEESRHEIQVRRLSAEVARLHRTLQTARLAAGNAGETVGIAEDLAEREGKRLALGTGITTDLVLAQQNAREAALTKLRAETNGALAAIGLSHLTGDLLASTTAPGVQAP